MQHAHQRKTQPSPSRERTHNEPDYRIVDPFHIQRDEATHLKPTYISNEIRTSKYTVVNFLPVCLLQEFQRVT